MPTVGVVIPTYNRAGMLAETITSVLLQSHTDFEVIVVDDGSKDATRAVAESFDDPRVTYVWQENQERCVARNNGARRADAEYLAFLDSDDLWFPHTLSRQLAAFEAHPGAGVVFGPCVRIDAQGSCSYPFDLLQPDGDDTVGNCHDELLVRCALSTPTILMRADVFRQCGQWDESHAGCEDWDLWIRLSQVCDFCRVSTPLAAYRVHESNSVHDLDREIAGHKSIWEKHAGSGDQRIREARLRSEIRTHARLGVQALARSLAYGEEWLTAAAASAGDNGLTDYLAEQMVNYVTYSVPYDRDEMLAAASRLRTAWEIAGLHRASTTLRDPLALYWKTMACGCRELDDPHMALWCVRRLIGDGGWTALDRGAGSLAVRSLIGALRKGPGRRRFPLEDELGLIVAGAAEHRAIADRQAERV